jgi:hypothetical protein
MALKFRRGTTAQQSGSLAYGEPYVNTDLGTLLVGGASGDIQLSNAGPTSTFAGASVSASTFVSASSLKVTGNATIDGNLTLGGNITIGDNTSDTVNVSAALSSSLIPHITNTFDLGSADKIWRDLYISTGSIKFVEGSTVVKTLSPSTLTALEAATGSANSAITSLESKTGSYASTGSNQFQDRQYVTGGINVYAVTDPDIRIGNGTTNIGYHIQNSDNGRFEIHNSTTGRILFQFQSSSIEHGNQNASFFGELSVSRSIVANSINATQGITGSIAATNGIVSGSSQIVGILEALNTFSASQETKDSTLGSLSGSFARTNSTNIFNGNQTITGSLYVTQDLVVQGSSSIQNISSSTLNIGTNLITVATNNPSVRFGGIAVVDSGSAGGSGSLLYDSIQDEFVFVHRGNGVNTTSSVFLLGPETYDNLGNETYLTTNKILKSTGKEHIVDSNITDTGTLITLGSNVEVTGNIALTGTVDGVDVSVLNSNINSFSSSALTRLTTLEVETNNLELFTSSINTTIKSKLDADGVISSSAQLTPTFDSRYLNTGGEGVVSGSAQIDVASTTGDIALGTRTSGNYVASLVAGTNITLTNNTGEGATPTIGLTNNTISGVSLGGNLATLTIGTGLSGTSYNGSSLVTIANTGVTSNVAGTGVTVSGATGAVTISIGQSVATNATPTFGNLTINGTITASGDITAFFTSDRRHKNNIQTIPNALDKISKLNGVTWEWNDDVSDVTKSTPKTGLIAQEVQEVLPQVVIEREDGFLALDYSKMVGLLVEAIKEQQTTISNLELQVTGLQNVITIFEDRMKEKGLL